MYSMRYGDGLCLCERDQDPINTYTHTHSFSHSLTNAMHVNMTDDDNDDDGDISTWKLCNNHASDKHKTLMIMSHYNWIVIVLVVDELSCGFHYHTRILYIECWLLHSQYYGVCNSIPFKDSNQKHLDIWLKIKNLIWLVSANQFRLTYTICVRAVFFIIQFCFLSQSRSCSFALVLVEEQEQKPIAKFLIVSLYTF